MPTQKTLPTAVLPADHLAAIEDDARRDDCWALVRLFTRITGHPPVMWGPSIVGFGSYHYRYPTGHEGDAPLVGFASGKRQLTVYLAPGFADEGTADLLTRLGKHKTGKGCLYLTRLSQVDLDVLEALVRRSVEVLRDRYPA